ncbi:MAG: glycerol-3-phosphate dehydrogenase subunit GlpB [Spirochaetes bacterium]|nr:glycerol-3-phosphate dehydrogenase subunit GlpB [Spirochaetota bacterium]
MKYDCIIIGGGISGLTAGIRCAKEGLHTAIISSGMSALHFSSGSIDVLGYVNNKVVYKPFEAIDSLTGTIAQHPYTKCGKSLIIEALHFFKKECETQNVYLYDNESLNHFHVTALGTLKPTYFSQRSVFNEDVYSRFRTMKKIVIINFEGYRDFHPQLAASQLSKHSLFKDCTIVPKIIEMPQLINSNKHPHEFRSIDIARIFEDEENVIRIADTIRLAAEDADFVIIPAIMGIQNFNQVHNILQSRTRILIYEVPTLPPSILGMRIDNALKTRFAQLGGVFIAGDKVVRADIKEDVVQAVYTANHPENPLEAKFYILSTGSFFSGGMVSEFNNMYEPIFNLKLHFEPERRQWYSPQFFYTHSHPFLEYGVITDENLRPYDSNNNIIQNVYCCGAILGYYNPIREGCGSGVAISTAFKAANHIIYLYNRMS